MAAILRIGLITCCVIIFTTALGKLFMLVDSNRYGEIWGGSNGVIPLVSDGTLITIVALLELLVTVLAAKFILYNKSLTMAFEPILWLCGCFWLYRVALSWLGLNALCNCFGVLKDLSGLNGGIYDALTLLLLIYMTVISIYGSIIYKESKLTIKNET